MSRFFLLVSLATIFLMGCAHKSDKSFQEQAEPKVSKEKLNQKIKEQLDQMVEAAKKSGEDKVRYLSNDLYLKASAATLEGDYPTANLIFSVLVKLVPDDDFVKEKYSISLIRTGELEEAQRLLEEVVQKGSSKQSKLSLILAGVYSSLGKATEAEKLYLNLINKDKKNSDACVFLAKNYSLDKKFNEAIKLLKRCQKRDLTQAIYSYQLGELYLEMRDFKKAKYHFKKAIKTDPDFDQAVIALGLIHEELKEYELAKKNYKNFLKDDSTNTLVLSRLVQIYFIQEEFKKVIPYARRLSDLEPENLNLKVKLGILHTDNKDYQKALQVFEEILTSVPKNDKILYYIAAIYQEMGNYQKSLEYYNEISTESGLYQDSSLQMAQMLSFSAIKEFKSTNEQGPSGKKLISFIEKKLDELKPLEVEFSIILANYLEQVNRYNDAVLAIEKVQDNSNFTQNHKFYQASLYEKTKNYPKANEIMLAILDEDPKNAHAWNFLGYSLLQREENLDQAYEYIKKALSFAPEDGYIRDSLGWYYYKTGDLRKALKEISVAIKKEPTELSIQKHLVIIYSELKDFRNAKSWALRALANSNSEKDKLLLEQLLKDLSQERLPASLSDLK